MKNAMRQVGLNISAILTPVLLNLHLQAQTATGMEMT